MRTYAQAHTTDLASSFGFYHRDLLRYLINFVTYLDPNGPIPTQPTLPAVSEHQPPSTDSPSQETDSGLYVQTPLSVESISRATIRPNESPTYWPRYNLAERTMMSFEENPIRDVRKLVIDEYRWVNMSYITQLSLRYPM